jgi:hypothetical protein
MAKGYLNNTAMGALAFLQSSANSFATLSAP